MSHADNDTLRNGFIRQRRNLILISLVLLFAETSELSISKLNVFGNELLIRNPVIITVALWVGWFYWSWRYYSYFHDLGEKGFGGRLREKLKPMLRRWVKMRFAADQSWRDEIAKAARQSVAFDAIDKELSQRPHSWEILEVTPLGQTQFREIPMQARMRLLFDQGDATVISPNEGHANFSSKGFNAMMFNIRAGLRVLIQTHIFSEYFLPFLIASAPLLYRLYGWLTR